MNNHTVITISRQYGSGGRELANKIAEKLGYKLFDRQIVHLAAAQIGIDDLSEDNLRNLENNVTPLSLSFIPFSTLAVEIQALIMMFLLMKLKQLDN